MARRYGVARYLLPLLVIATLAEAASEATHHSIGPGHGTVVASDRENPCPGSELLVNADGSYESGYIWQYGGVLRPYFGAFAEGYTAVGTVCGISYKLTSIQHQMLHDPMDCYLWASDGVDPLHVLAVVYDFFQGTAAIWPNISTHDADIPDTDVAGAFFVGFWPIWPGSWATWYVAADLDGPGGMPRTHIAPGIGYPSGWQDPSVVWGPTQAMGIDAYVLPAPPTTVQHTTWGWIKMLAR